MREPRRLLIVTLEPPPTSSGLGTLWSKLSMGATAADFVIDFLGPDPARCSNHGHSGLPLSGQLHELGAPPLSRTASVKRNITCGTKRLAWGILRAPYALFERRTGRNLYEEWSRRRIAVCLPPLLKRISFDAVAVKAPPLEIAETVRGIARAAGTPFVYIMGDPIGRRDDVGALHPLEAERQQDLIESASAFVTRKASYERHYRHSFRINPAKLVFFEDSFIPVGLLEEHHPLFSIGEHTLLHWGQIDPWRPIDTLVEAIKRANVTRRSEDRSPLGLTVMGQVIEERMMALARHELGALFTKKSALPYLDARAVARTACCFVVIVSPRHRDNIPSKLIDALAYGRPILLLAHPDSAAAQVVIRLGVGAVADVRDVTSIVSALSRLEGGRERYEMAFQRDSLAQEWAFESVGRRFRDRLFTAMGWRGGVESPQ